MKFIKKNAIFSIVLILVIVASVWFFLDLNEKNYEVMFSSNGESLYFYKINKDSTIERPEDPKRDGYIFDNWYLDDKVFDFNTKVNKKIELVAKWKKVEKEVELTYFVNFETDGGSKLASLKINDGEMIAKPTNPTKEGYDFISWQLDGKDFDFSTKITKDITLIATWEKKVTNTTTIRHKITFDSAGGSAVPYKMVDKTKAVSKPADPTRSGYKFIGWYLNNTLYNFSKGVYDNITLVAKWQQVQSNITYSISWVKIESSSIGQYTLYIRSSKGNYVSGKVRLTTTAGTTSVVDIPSTGKIYIKSAVADVTVESVN